jgi:hypothetical protein
MVKKEDFFKCFSGKLKKFLLEQGNDYIMKADNCLTHRTFWLFPRTELLDKSLTMWNETNPNK